MSYGSSAYAGSPYGGIGFLEGGEAPPIDLPACVALKSNATVLMIKANGHDLAIKPGSEAGVLKPDLVELWIDGGSCNT